MPALLILTVGIAVVLGMIIFLRINAFIALITAAIVVSLLAPGEVSSKISRVADAFGSSAGAIGIVIALAAVIGQCMMESGAADRIVRAFLKVLGEKRASFALMGSGFVLAVPVFFDTVFYLLVPLARSLYRKTKKNYVLYILAISAGGAITHTLVPPTPGPLIMAATLGIDIGLMILVGLIVAFPAALAGIAVSGFFDRRFNIPMRPTGGQPEPEALDDSQLPTLFAALLPILLPVLMISCNTIVTTMADAQRPGMIRVSEITSWSALSDGLTNSLAGRHISAQLQAVGVESVSASPTDDEQTKIVAGLNRVLANRRLFSPEAFEAALPPEWKVDQSLAMADIAGDSTIANAARLKAFYGLHRSLGSRTKPVVIERMNRLLLEATFPNAIDLHVWDTPLRTISEWTSLIGDANLALLLATAAAILVYLQQRRPMLDEMARSVEGALMSGGAIILITAAGGAFGAMLATAQIGPAIEGLFTVESGSGGTFFLFLGFGIAALLKVAQGSSTTAMIVVSGMLAPTVASVDLPYNPVYIATAIGAGSLVGSWMNDSGFWIFAKMSGLTETEALKTWTPLLLVLAVVSMSMTVILSMVLPLV